MGKSKVRTLLMASVMIMLCAAMIVGGTYALWSSSATINNHLEAGSLSIKLERLSYSKTYLDKETGYLKTKDFAPTEPDDFSGSTTENVFGLDSDELIAPNSSYSARLKLTNNGDVAFTYDIIIKLSADSDDDLASQLKVYVDDDENGHFLSEYANDGSAIISTQTLAKSASNEFTVKIEFVNDDNNNAAKSQNVYFDLLVKATQKTAQATTQE